MKTRIFLFILTFSFNSIVLGATTSNINPDPPVDSYLVINADTGDVIAQKNPNDVHAPASLTKLMTLYLTMEAIKKGVIRWDQIYTTTKKISQIGGSEAHLWPGEKISVRDLFKSAAVGSANDAAAALAEIISGNSDDFVKLMNQKARELGLLNTYFRSPHGLPVPDWSPKDYTTANDLAKLSLAILNNHPEILEFTRVKSVYIRKGKWRFINTNKLIGKFPGLDGLKTGFTNNAGFCLVATAKQNNMRVISVLMGAKSNKERFLYTAQLLNDAFSRFTNIYINCKGKTFEVPIPDSINPYDIGIARKDLLFMVPKSRVSEICYELYIANNLEAPIARGGKIGEYVASVNGDILARADVRAKDDVKKAGFFRRLFGG